jgi:glycosyltransferase involved in cell wall biosynthesis
MRQRRRVLFIDDRVPHPALGSGFPRSYSILSTLAKLGYFVTLFPTAVIDEPWRDVYADIPREIEVMLGYGPDKLHPFLASRKDYYDLLLISRPHNMRFAKPIFQAYPDWFRNTRIIYDAEALFTARELASLRLMGANLDSKSAEQLTMSEVELVAEANLVVSVSKLEAEEFARYGIRNVRVLGHSISVAPTPRAFEERCGFLFVGSILEENSPNGDAVLWFIKEMLPLIRHRLGDVPFTIAGINNIDLSSSSTGGQVRILGKVEDLTAVYDEARVFVAPTRFSAGIPHKIHEAAARGVPAVATSLLMRQLGWAEGTHLLVADEPRTFAEQCVRLHNDASLWERIRRDALQQVRMDCSPETFEAALKSIFEG